MNSGNGADDTRPDLFLKHLAMFGVTVRPIVRTLFCDGSPSKTENLFGRLLKQKRILRYSLSKNPRRSYYTLSADEAARLAVSIPKGRLSGRAINESLAILYYCHRGGSTVRRRASGSRIEQRLGFPLKSAGAPFVVQDEPDPFVARMIVPGRETRTDYALKIVQAETHYLSRFPEARDWLREGIFRFVIVTYSEARQCLFADAISSAKARQRLPEYVCVEVACIEDPYAIEPQKESSQ